MNLASEFRYETGKAAIKGNSRRARVSVRPTTFTGVVEIALGVFGDRDFHGYRRPFGRRTGEDRSVLVGFRCLVAIWRTKRSVLEKKAVKIIRVVITEGEAIAAVEL